MALLSVILSLCLEVGLFECLFLFLVVLCFWVEANCWATWIWSCPMFLEVSYFLGERQVRKLGVWVVALPKWIYDCSFLLICEVDFLLLGPRVAYNVAGIWGIEIVQVNYHLVAEVKHIQSLWICQTLRWCILQISLSVHRGHVHWELTLVLLLSLLDLLLGRPSTSFFVWNFAIFDTHIESSVDGAVILLCRISDLIECRIIILVPCFCSIRVGSLRGIGASPCPFESHLLLVPRWFSVSTHILFSRIERHLGLTLLVGIGEAIKCFCSGESREVPTVVVWLLVLYWEWSWYCFGVCRKVIKSNQSLVYLIIFNLF